jgi:hypothetical protein
LHRFVLVLSDTIGIRLDTRDRLPTSHPRRLSGPMTVYLIKSLGPSHRDTQLVTGIARVLRGGGSVTLRGASIVHRESQPFAVVRQIHVVDAPTTWVKRRHQIAAHNVPLTRLLITTLIRGPLQSHVLLLARVTESLI